MKTPIGGTAMVDTMERLQNGHWPEWYVETICQPWKTNPGHTWPMEQVYAFMVIDDWIQRGALAVVDIEVGEEPHRDSDRRGNQAALDGLDVRYTATVDQTQHCADSDGTFAWNDRLSVSVRVEPGEWSKSSDSAWLDAVVTKADEAPLEIGSTTASATAFHLAETRALARWPYGHRSIRLFLDAEVFDPMALDIEGRVRVYSPPKPMDQRTLPHPEDLRKGA
jgi:hypothetical protein